MKRKIEKLQFKLIMAAAKCLIEAAELEKLKHGITPKLDYAKGGIISEKKEVIIPDYMKCPPIDF